MIGIQSIKTESVFRLEARVFGKLLHLARFQGWRPQKVSYQWPSAEWNTETILPHLGPYLLGDVSEEDAKGLTEALTQVKEVEAAALDAEEYAALLTLIALLKHGPVRTGMVSKRPPPKGTS